MDYDHLEQEVRNIEQSVQKLNARVGVIESQLEKCVGSNQSLTELQVILKELVNWRKVSEQKIAAQSETLLRVSLLLDNVTKRQDEHTSELIKLREQTQQESKESAISVNDIIKKAFWLIFGSVMAYFIKFK